MILTAIVGGSTLVAAFAMMKRIDGWELSSIVAGMIMVVWIVGEIASIRGFHILQALYLITGLLVLWWTPGSVQRAEDVSLRRSKTARRPPRALTRADVTPTSATV